MIILKTKTNLPDEDFQYLYRTIYNMKENGLIILPPGIEVVHISEKEKAKIICEDVGELPEFLKKKFNQPEQQEEKRYCRDCKHFWQTNEYEPALNGFKSYYGCNLNHINRRLRITDKTEDCGLFEEKEKGNE